MKVRGDLEDYRTYNHRPHDEELDKQILDFFISFRSKNLPVTRKLLEAKALQFNTKPGFKASEGWLTCFLKRNNISSRKRTHVIQKLTENFHTEIKDYFKAIDELKIKYGDNIVYINFDEVPFCFDFSSDRTYCQKGQKEVNLLTHNALKKKIHRGNNYYF